MNYEKLNSVVDESGLKRSFIAEKIGLSPKIFHDRMTGASQWKACEISKFCTLLGIKKRQRDAIFFAQM